MKDFLVLLILPLRKRYIFLLFGAVILYSCNTSLTVEKRRYNPGFFASLKSGSERTVISNDKGKKNHKNNSDTTQKKSAEEKENLNAEKHFEASDAILQYEKKSFETPVNTGKADYHNEINFEEFTSLSKNYTFIGDEKNDTIPPKREDPRFDGMSIAALGAGLSSILSIELFISSLFEFFFDSELAIIFLLLWLTFSILAIIFGASSIQRIKKGERNLDIKLARKGLRMGIAGLSLYLLLSILLVLGVFTPLYSLLFFLAISLPLIISGSKKASNVDTEKKGKNVKSGKGTLILGIILLALYITFTAFLFFLLTTW